MEDTTEYYWDEDTQMYYYWDEATQAYYPWVENEESQQAGAIAESSTEPNEESCETQQPQADAATTAVVASNDPEDETESSHMSSSDAAPSPREPGEAPQGAEFFQRGGVRNATRKLSFASHGGLSGVLRIVNAQRRSTVHLTDEDIKAAQQRERLREKLEEAGVVLDPPKPKLPPPELPETPSTNPNDNIRNIFVNVQRQKQEQEQPSYRRRSTIRFGTSEFNDPAFQSRLEAMLGSSVKKK